MKINDCINNVFPRGFVPHIHKPTTLMPPTATLIDNIYTNDNSDTNICSSGITVMGVADHSGTFHLVKNKKEYFAKLKQLLYQLNFDDIIKRNILPN